MRLALSRQNAIDVFAHKMKDRQFHYGLIFPLPPGADCARAGKCSDLDTSSRHGQVDNWWLGVPEYAPTPGQAVLLIPRTWLIRQGFLPWSVLFFPYLRFNIRRFAALQQHVWLEWPAPETGEEATVEPELARAA